MKLEATRIQIQKIIIPHAQYLTVPEVYDIYVFMRNNYLRFAKK